MQPTSMSLPENVDAFVKVFLGALGGTSTKQVVLTVTPAPSSTSSQPLQTPVGTVSDGHLPYPYGRE
jgi:hypothetical protein